MAYGAWIDKGIAKFRYDGLANIYGPFRFYVGTYMVDCGLVYQMYPRGGKMIELHFPIALIGSLPDDVPMFDFRAVTVTVGNVEHAAFEGEMPHPDKSLGVK